MNARHSGDACRACGAFLPAPWFTVASTPCHSVVLVDDADSAAAFPSGAVSLCRCAECGLIQNAAFRAARLLYDQRYEGSQLYSAHFRAFAESLADRLAARFAIGKHSLVVEIGCGQGDFLQILCRRAGCRGAGIDPAARAASGEGFTLVTGRFEDHRDIVSGADLVLCRHTLEHVERPVDFLTGLHQALGDSSTPVFFDVPDVRRILADGAFWDVYYEHCNYFGAASLAGVFHAAGFRVDCVERAFHSQSLEISARRAGAGEKPPAMADDERSLCPAFAARAEAALARWRRRLRDARVERGPVVLWGAGSKAVAFVAATGAASDIALAVDVNPLKQGRYLPGSSLPVVAPAALRVHQPAVAIAMNGAYFEEIGATLADLSPSCELWSVDRAP